MHVNNVFAAESLRYTEDKPNLLVRSDEIADFSEISDYCSKIQENLLYDEDNVFYEKIEEGIEFWEWLYEQKGSGKEDDRRMLMEIFSKQKTAVYLEEDENVRTINCGLGKDSAWVSDGKTYVGRRREILSEIQKPDEYEAFMHSCFLNSCFAPDILQGMKYIEDFSYHTEEITKNLAVLNDKALKLFLQYRNNLKEAERIFTSMLLECSDDPNHREHLWFPFTYIELLDGETVKREKAVLCEPHLKLIRRDSDLRIYFWWCDDKVGKGEKVLVGHIGRHPY